MTQSVSPSAPIPVRAIRAYRAQSRIASALQIIALLAATALLSGIIFVSLLAGMLDLVATANH